MNVGTGKPVENGTYAAEVYFGWKILAWCEGQWWHDSHVARWTASEPVQWIGPLPARLKMPVAQYDL